MYGQLATGKPEQIISRTSARAPAHYFEVQIDTKKNEPRILEKKQIGAGARYRFTAHARASAFEVGQREIAPETR